MSTTILEFVTNGFQRLEGWDQVPSAKRETILAFANLLEVSYLPSVDITHNPEEVPEERFSPTIGWEDEDSWYIGCGISYKNNHELWVSFQLGTAHTDSHLHLSVKRAASLVNKLVKYLPDLAKDLVEPEQTSPLVVRGQHSCGGSSHRDQEA